MARPTKIQVVKKQDGYEITCVDEMTGSATGMDIPIKGYEALEQHFETGAMEVSSDELAALPLHNVSQQRELLLAFFDCLLSETPTYKIRHINKEMAVDFFLKANNCG